LKSNIDLNVQLSATDICDKLTLSGNLNDAISYYKE